MTEDNKPSLARAFAQPLPVIIIFVGLIVGAATGSGWGLLLIAAAFAGAFATAAAIRRSPAFLRKEQMIALAREKAERKLSSRQQVEKLEEESRVIIKGILSHFEDIDNEIVAMGIGGMGPEYTQISLQTNLFVKRAMQLAEKRTQMRRFLIKSDVEGMRERILRSEEELAANPNASEQDKRVLEAQKKELANIEHAESACAEILKHLEMTAVLMSQLRSHFLSLKVQDAQAQLEVHQTYSAQFDQLNEALDQLEADTAGFSAVTQ